MERIFTEEKADFNYEICDEWIRRKTIWYICSKYIKFRERIANVSNELYFNGYYDRYAPSIFGNVYGQFRVGIFTEKEVGQTIMRLRTI